MRFRAFITLLLATTLLIASPQREASAIEHLPATTDSTVDDGVTRPTINDFLPENRPLGDCLSSLPKPNCGSDARGGWAQTAVFVAILAGLAFIAWRIVAASRRARGVRAEDG